MEQSKEGMRFMFNQHINKGKVYQGKLNYLKQTNNKEILFGL